jgi:hypothetical protein
MKDQYFGDVSDYRKYALLRLLALPVEMRLGICWMLTESDDRSDGQFLAYLDQPESYRHYDPVLFDWLRQVVRGEKDRRTARIESSGLLGMASFQSAILTDDITQRRRYFFECRERFAGTDLVFFDPDNGIEVKSIPCGRRSSSKFLYWSEVREIFSAGHSVIIYQHFIREERMRFIRRMLDELREMTGAATVFSFRTPHVLFMLAAQDRHAEGFCEQVKAISTIWHPKQIIGEERS